MSSIAAFSIQEQERRASEKGRKFRVKKVSLPKKIVGIERDYYRSINAIFEKAVDLVDQLLIPRLPEIQSKAGIKSDANRDDAFGWPKDVRDIFSIMAVAFARQTENAAAMAAGSMSDEVNTQNQINVNRQFNKALGVDVFVPGTGVLDIIDAALEENVSLIRSIPETYFREVQDLVLRNFKAGRRASDIATQIQRRTGVARNRAALIARDQVNKLNGALTKNRQESLGLEKYIWRTSRDERVRETHSAVDGMVFSWNEGAPDGRGGRMHPGEEINCRCTGEAYFGDLLK